jgi:hypothetical protein
MSMMGVRRYRRPYGVALHSTANYLSGPSGGEPGPLGGGRIDHSRPGQSWRAGRRDRDGRHARVSRGTDRQNTRMVASSIAQAHRDARNEATRVVADNPESARVYREGLLDPNGLAKAERYQFDALISLSLNFFEQAIQPTRPEHGSLQS